LIEDKETEEKKEREGHWWI